MRKLYVGSLPYSVTDSQLQKIFEQHGPVRSVRVISDRATGRSRGFGFVEMESENAAREAMETLNQSQLDGRTLIVSEARSQGRAHRVASAQAAYVRRPVTRSR